MKFVMHSLWRYKRQIFCHKLQKTIIHLLVISLFTGGCVATTPQPPKSLTKAQKLEDFDAMQNALLQAYPGDAITNVYGFDTYEKLSEYRAQISEEGTPEDFALFLNHALKALKGNHLGQSDLLYWHRDNKYIRQFYSNYVSDEAIDINHQYMINARIPIVSIPLLYYDGDYYTKHNFTFKKVKYKRGMRLLAIDGRTPQEILPTIQDRLDRFDVSRKIFYGASFSGGYVQDNFYLFLDADSPHTFELQDGHDIVKISINAAEENVEFPDNLRMFFCFRKIVMYLADKQILYIKIPQMRENDLPYYLDEIKKYKDKKIDAVIIDVRYNPGGSDRVWISILQAIIDREYKWDVKTAIKNTELAREYQDRHSLVCCGSGINWNNYHLIRLTFLNNKEFLVGNTTKCLVPCSESLKLNVPIYIIAHDIYSSTGGLLACANEVDNFISVGTKNPQALGRGIDPLYVSLPNSKFIFSVATDLDITGCKSLQDVLKTAVEVEVPMTLSQKIAYLNSGPGYPPMISYLWGAYQEREIPFWKDWLEKEDPYFRKVVHLIEQRKQKASSMILNQPH